MLCWLARDSFEVRITVAGAVRSGHSLKALSRMMQGKRPHLQFHRERVTLPRIHVFVRYSENNIALPKMPRKAGPYDDFALGGLATASASIISNPFEVIKTRMQVQSELVKQSKSQLAYRNVFHAFGTILKDEGIRGIQRGLSSAMCYQIAMNSVRLGLYPVLKDVFGANNPRDTSSWLKSIGAGAMCGAAGALTASPLYLVKARLQVSGGKTNNAGHQYRGPLDALRKIHANEGVAGLYRGCTASMLRTGMGSSVQLSSYDQAKHLVLSTGFFEDNVYAHFSASLVTGFAVTLVMNPFDVVSTRLYNQTDGRTLYNGISDCFSQILRSEGLPGLYKGYWAHYLRLGPHTIFTFVFLEQLRNLASMLLE